jgi:hypothetical protein
MLEQMMPHMPPVFLDDVFGIVVGQQRMRIGHG